MAHPLESSPGVPQTEEEIRQGIADAWGALATRTIDGVDDLRQQIMIRQAEENRLYVGDWFGDQGLAAQVRGELKNRHPLTAKQEEDVRRGIAGDFGPPLFG